jgi:hypothetical protein
MENLKNWKTWLLFVIAALVEWAVTRLLDTAGPKTISFVSGIYHAVTLGSQKLDDVSYRDAPLNLLPTEACLCLSLLIFIAMALQIWRFLSKTSPMEWRMILPQGVWGWVGRLGGVLERPVIKLGLRLAGLVVAIGILELIGTVVEIETKAALIRSSYETNRDEIAPYLTEQERIEMQSEFVQIDGKADFVRLTAKMKAIALDKKIALRAVPSGEGW